MYFLKLRAWTRSKKRQLNVGLQTVTSVEHNLPPQCSNGQLCQLLAPLKIVGNAWDSQVPQPRISNISVEREYDRISKDTILRNSVRKQESSFSVLGSILASFRLVIQTRVCFAFSRAIEDITTIEMLYKGRESRDNFLGLINFCIKPLSSHIWFLQRGAQLGPRCVYVCVSGNANAQWWGFPDKTAPQGRWQRYEEKDRLNWPNNADSWQKGLCGLFNTLELNQHSLLTTESAIFFWFFSM